MFSYRFKISLAFTVLGLGIVSGISIAVYIWFATITWPTPIRLGLSLLSMLIVFLITVRIIDIILGDNGNDDRRDDSDDGPDLPPTDYLYLENDHNSNLSNGYISNFFELN